MSFQLRHKDLGVFQGEALGLGFWYALGDKEEDGAMPEQGYCELKTQADAQFYVDALCAPEREHPMRREDFTIEPYDRETSERLRAEGLRKSQIRDLQHHLRN